MKVSFKLILVTLFLGVFLVGCSTKDDGPVYDPVRQLEIEMPILEAYADSLNTALDNIELTRDDRYQIWFGREESDSEPFEYFDEQDEFVNPYIVLKYKGRLLSGQVFEEKTEDGVIFRASGNIIAGIAVALFPYEFKQQNGQNVGLFEGGLKVGDKVRLVIPSPYAYGQGFNEVIPANSPLDFELEVVSITVENPEDTSNPE